MLLVVHVRGKKPVLRGCAILLLMGQIPNSWQEPKWPGSEPGRAQGHHALGQCPRGGRASAATPQDQSRPPRAGHLI